MRKKIGFNKKNNNKRLTELRGDKKKTFKVMLPLQQSPPPVILCKMMDSTRASSSDESTASQVLQDSRSHRLAPTGVWTSNINPPGWKGNVKASQCLWRQHEWLGLKEEKEALVSWLDSYDTPTIPTIEKTWDFGINVFQGGFEISLEPSENYIHVQFMLLSLVPGQVGRLTCSHSPNATYTYYNSRNVTELENILKKPPWNMQEQEKNLR